MKMICVAVIAATATTGCAAIRNMEADRAMTAANAACMTADADPSLAPLRSIIPNDAMSATPSQVANPSYATPEQQRLIDGMEAVYGTCYQLMSDFYARYAAPGAASVYAQLRQESKTLVAGLYARKITFGQFNEAKARAVTNAYMSMQRAENSHAQNLAAAEAQRQQNAAIMLPFLMQASRPAPAPQPYIMQSPPSMTTTNCNRYGNSVSCTSF